MIPFLDLHKINKRFKIEFHEALREVIQDSQYILGNYVSKFEKEFAGYCGTKYSVGVASGLDALTLILKGYMHLGKLKKGDKVIVPANTYIATVLPLIHAELEPVFVEPFPNDFNLDSEAVALQITKDVKAILMVHLYGQLADVKALSVLAKRNRLLLISDAAQAHGASLKNKKAGSFADAAAFSFYPTKNLGALGDGGAITTNDKTLDEAIRVLRNYGSKKKNINDVVGFNSRLDDLQAAFLSVKLKQLDMDNAKRRVIAEQYLTKIQNPHIKLPIYNGGTNHVFYVFVVRVKDRMHFTAFLNKYDIGWHIHYPIPPHQQKALAKFNVLSLPITEQLSQEVVSLPISPVMSVEEIDRVIKVVNDYKL